MKYNFDEIISREGTNAMSVDGYQYYLFNASIELSNPYPDFIRMWVADMEFAVAPEIIEGIKARLDQRIIGYTKVFDPNYHKVFSNWTLSRYGIEFDRDKTVYASGVIPALFDITGYVCQPGDKLLISTPSYAFFKHAADFNEVELVTSPLRFEKGKFQIDFEDFEQQASDKAVKIFMLCSPHNPTGRIWTEEELLRMGQICLENNVVIIADEIHCDLLRKGKSFTPLAKLFPHSDQIITCMAPSKTFSLAGMKMANIVIPNEKIRAAWDKKFYRMENPLSIAAAQSAYQYGSPWLEQLTTYLDGNFMYLESYLKEHLPKAEFAIPDATYLAWINMGAYFKQGENLTLFFANHAGVLLEGGNMFVSDAEGYIRLNLACPLSKLKEGLRRITKAIREK